MAAPGDLELGSAELEQTSEIMNCVPCTADGNNIKAVGFCVNCQEHLCQRCFDGHLIPSVTKKHVLLDREKMKTAEGIEISVYSKKCLEHPDKIAEYHCPSHGFFGCHICFFKHHKKCTDVGYIPEISKAITDSEEYKDFNEKMTTIATKCAELVAKIKRNLKTLRGSHEITISAIKDFKKEVIDAVNNLEQQLTDTANTAKVEKSVRMTAMYEQVTCISSENQKIASIMELLRNKKHNCDLYTMMKESNDKLQSLENDMHTAENSIRRMRTTLRIVKGNTDVLQTLKNMFDIVTDEGKTIQHLEKHCEINVKCNTDGTNCRIVGSALLSNNNIVLTDDTNRKVKLLDTSQNQIVSYLQLDSHPFGVCTTTNTEVAVAVPYRKELVFAGTEPTLSVKSTLSVNGVCYGVGYCGGKLFVSYNQPSKVEILDMQGHVLKLVSNDDKGQPLFNQPYQLGINPDNKLVYVSNYYTNNFVCLTFDGTVMAKYTDNELFNPWQIVFDSSGTVHVCGQGSHNIHQVTWDCKKVKVILPATEGLDYPESICYSELDAKLYISRRNLNNISVYSVKTKLNDI